jgi:hypothetical protein
MTTYKSQDMTLDKQIWRPPPDRDPGPKVTMWLCCLAMIALAAAGCGGSSGSKNASDEAPATAGATKAGAPAKVSVKLPAKGCGLLSDVAVTALLGGSPTSSSELRPPGVSPPGSVIGCIWRGAGGRQAGITLHQGSTSARDFAENAPRSRLGPRLGMMITWAAALTCGRSPNAGRPGVPRPRTTSRPKPAHRARPAAPAAGTSPRARSRDAPPRGATPPRRRGRTW